MKSTIQNDVIFRLRKLREARGYSQAKVAALLCISSGQIGNIESPKHSHKYTLAQLETLSEEFNVPIESLFFDPEERHGPITIKEFIHRIIEYQE
jgi:transcriptional regulator with XRE-family HTH domain